jgi:hypothetical protein
MAAYCIDPRGAAGAPGEVHSTQLNTVGVVREFSDGHYIYLAGVTGTVSGDFICFKPGVYTTARLTTGMRGNVAIATAAVDATTKWGWFGYVGSFAANCLSATLSNGFLFATATAGSAEDALIKNEQIRGATATGAPVTTTGGGSQTVVIDRPTVGNSSESA